MFPRFWKDETEQQGLPAESTLDHPLVTPAELPVEDVRGSQSSPEEVEIEEGLRRLADLEDRSAEPGESEAEADADVEPDEAPPRFFPRYKPRRRKTPLTEEDDTTDTEDSEEGGVS